MREPTSPGVRPIKRTTRTSSVGASADSKSGVSGGRRRGGGPSLKVIKWRDLPAQVNGTAADQKVQVELPPRFQKAIDRAAMIAGKTDANSYIAEMTQETVAAAGDDIEADVAALVTDIEAEFTLERLNEFVATGGWRPDGETQ